MAAPRRSDGAGLLRVDHIAQTMHYEEMLSWPLYYLSLFDVDEGAGRSARRSAGAGAEPGHRVPRRLASASR